MAEGGSTEFVTLYMTAAGSHEAASIAEALVEERLVACANVFDGVTSYFRWEGKVQAEGEVVVIAKTRASLVSAVEARLKDLHSYDVPCLVAWPIVDGHSDYLNWIAEETRDD